MLHSSPSRDEDYEAVMASDSYFFSQRPRGKVLWGVCFKNILKVSLSILARDHNQAKFLIV